MTATNPPPAKPKRGIPVILSIVVEPNPPTHPCIHGHLWAYAMLVSGGTRQVCRVCGRERR